MHHSHLAVLFALCTATVAAAQTEPRAARPTRWVVGPRFGFDLDAGGVDASEPFTGAQLVLDTGRRWHPIVSVDVSGRDGILSYRVNADVHYHLPVANDMFYLGGGLAIPHLAAGHSPGANIMVGWEWQRETAFRPFAETKLVIYSVYTSLNLLTGVTVGF
jgi:hypothetical protein